MRSRVPHQAPAASQAGAGPATAAELDQPEPPRSASAPGGTGERAEKRLLVVSLGVVIGYLASLASMFVGRTWVLDAAGRPIPTDFVAIWSAGRLVLKGAALSAYNGSLQHATEAAAVGRDFPGYYGWPYPPSFLFVAAAMASLPYAWAFALLVVASLALHGLSVAAIARRFAGMIVAFAAPWALACALVGQNGFLTAGLIGFILLTMDEQPALSGLLLGLLTYKPHFGLLFPIALLASGRWRVFAWAAASTLCLTGASVLVFGADTFGAFLHGLPQTTTVLVTNGAVGWNKLQSIYGLARSMGASNEAGWAAQGVMTLVCAAAIAMLWRGRAPTALKAASLAVAAVLATPYVFAYDLPVLAVAAAFLYRHRGFDRLDYLALYVAAASLIALPFVTVSTGLFASLAIAAAVGRRVLAALPRSAAA